MKNKILVDIVKDKNLIIPLYMFRLMDKLNLDYKEFIVLMYLYNKGELVSLNVVEMCNDLGFSQKDIMIIIGELNSKKLVDFKVNTNDKGIREEFVSLDDFYNKVSLLLMDEEENNDDDSSNIFLEIEREFGRTLSPIEVEIVKAWLENNFSEELIRCALEEAVLNGVSNLRYIDKILFEWNKKGIKTREDVEKNRINHRKKEEKTSVEPFEYDWLNDDENR